MLPSCWPTGWFSSARPRRGRRAMSTASSPTVWRQARRHRDLPSLASVSSGSEQARHCWHSGRRAARGPRRAFLATLRTVVDPGGQAINATDKLPVMAETPTTIVWGGRGRLIPVRPGRQAHRAIPNSRLEIFPKAGHFPHLEEPRRFAGLLVDFVEQTEDRLVQTAVPPDGHRAGSASAAGPD